jgi:predicted phosphodiesterase
MKIRLMSDLHLEFGNYKIPPLSDDKNTVLVLAGDINVGRRGIDWICTYANSFKAIVYVLGNHEFYDNDVVEVIRFWKRRDLFPSNVYFLHNDFKHIGNVTFIGTTLWTDFKNGNWFEMQLAGRNINDFSLSTYNGSKYTPQVHLELHQGARRFLTNALESTTGRRVVITHFLPSWSAITDQFIGQPFNSYFAANMDDLINKHQPDLWLFGHTHDSVDKMLGSTRIVCNPRGYTNHHLNPTFNGELVLEI